MFGWILIGAAAAPLVGMVGKELWQEAVHAVFLHRYTENRTPRGPIPPGGMVIEAEVFVEVEA